MHLSRLKQLDAKGVNGNVNLVSENNIYRMVREL